MTKSEKQCYRPTVHCHNSTTQGNHIWQFRGPRSFSWNRSSANTRLAKFHWITQIRNLAYMYKARSFGDCLCPDCSKLLLWNIGGGISKNVVSNTSIWGQIQRGCSSCTLLSDWRLWGLQKSPKWKRICPGGGGSFRADPANSNWAALGLGSRMAATAAVASHTCSWGDHAVVWHPLPYCCCNCFQLSPTSMQPGYSEKEQLWSYPHLQNSGKSSRNWKRWGGRVGRVCLCVSTEGKVVMLTYFENFKKSPEAPPLWSACNGGLWGGAWEQGYSHPRCMDGCSCTLLYQILDLPLLLAEFWSTAEPIL